MWYNIGGMYTKHDCGGGVWINPVHMNPVEFICRKMIQKIIHFFAIIHDNGLTFYS